VSCRVTCAFLDQKELIYLLDAICVIIMYVTSVRSEEGNDRKNKLIFVYVMDERDLISIKKL
jgi:hypothetical protein